MKINDIETNLPNPASVKQEQPSSLTENQNQSANNRQPNNGVKISLKAQKLSSVVGNRTSDIETQQQAKQVAQEIQKNIQTSPELAITAQVNVVPALLSNLLG